MSSRYELLKPRKDRTSFEVSLFFSLLEFPKVIDAGKVTAFYVFRVDKEVVRMFGKSVWVRGHEVQSWVPGRCHAKSTLLLHLSTTDERKQCF